MEIAAMKHQMRRAEAPCRGLAELEPVPGLACAPVAQFAGDGQHPDFGERLFEAERVEDARAVRSKLDAGTDLLELVRLFIDLDVEPAFEQCERGREPADAAADDDDLVRRHDEMTNGSNGQARVLVPGPLCEHAARGILV